MAGGAYDRFMGRYSVPLAGELADWLGVTAGGRALDVGCGPGALTEVLVGRLGADRVAAVDPSPPFVEACRERNPGVDVRRATADALPFDDGHFDVSAANLVVHFMPDPVAGLTEMARVTRAGCWVGATVWDLVGGRTPMSPVWDNLSRLQPDHPGEAGLPGGSPDQLEKFFTLAGLADVTVTELAVTVTHPTFEEWWTPYLASVGPVGDAIAALDPAVRERLVAACRQQLGDGPFELTAVAHAGRGRV